MSYDGKEELDLNAAQKIFGYFDRSQLINLFELILKGQESKVIDAYRKIYNQGIEPKVFINDFLEILYYFKNINSLTVESTNFSLNDLEFSQIKDLSDKLEKDILILFWQFTIKTLDELDIVSNQHLSIEMFLIRLMRIYNPTLNKDPDLEKGGVNKINSNEVKPNDAIINSQTVNQIKNISQERDIKPKVQNEIKTEDLIMIKSFEQLLKICSIKKEIRLKYELENNVNLVSFENKRIEISFNENLDKNFLKDLTNKLLEWTNERWIITLSKSKGQLSINDQKINEKKRRLI